jgi:hypothetical protein
MDDRSNTGTIQPIIGWEIESNIDTMKVAHTVQLGVLVMCCSLVSLQDTLNRSAPTCVKGNKESLTKVRMMDLAQRNQHLTILLIGTSGDSIARGYS